ncbi:MAG: CHAT domain-containing protein [Candidatus Bathyarchaeia archaeon]
MNEDYGILLIRLNREKKKYIARRYLQFELAIPKSMQILRLNPMNFPRNVEEKIRRHYVNILKMTREDEKANARKFKQESKRLGQVITKTFLKTIIEKFDIDLDSEKNIAIALDEETVKIPWELGFINDMPIRFCDKCNVGRLRIVEHESWHVPTMSRSPRIGDRALVVGINYIGSPTKAKRLKYAEEEAAKIKVILENYFKVTLLRGEEATKDRILKELQKGVKVFHFTGHGGITKDKSGILAFDGELTTQEFDESLEITDTPAPCLSFMNACETSTEFSTVTDVEWKSYSWAFMMADCGGRAFIGTFWPINDCPETASFSCNFYKEFFDKEKPIAKALQKVRKALVSRDETNGYAYVLYGPPTLKKRDII